jgi:hypothetical protein
MKPQLAPQRIQFCYLATLVEKQFKRLLLPRSLATTPPELPTQVRNPASASGFRSLVGR